MRWPFREWVKPFKFFPFLVHFFIYLVIFLIALKVSISCRFEKNYMTFRVRVPGFGFKNFQTAIGKFLNPEPEPEPHKKAPKPETR